MNRRLLVAAALLAAPAAASAMPVETFLAKAAALEKKGALAMFSGDLKLLMNQVKQDAAGLRAANQAAEKAGRPKAYCAPPAVKMTDRDIMGAMRAVPAAERPGTTTREALRRYMAKRFPCPAG
jgi:hypothetical protein